MTTTPLDQSAYRAGWLACHDGQRAQVPVEWLATDATIDGWIWGWIDYVLSIKSNEVNQTVGAKND